jgi:DNA (cytosine-5)-methyltransferase 1
MPVEARPTVLSGFSGVGGLDLGLEAAGFTHVGSIELDETARRSLKANRDDEWPLLDTGDILDVAEALRPADVGLRRRELTLLAGAPPCQPFSKAAQWSRTSRIGLEDERSDCLDGFLGLAETFLPKAILLENVTGFAQGAIAALPEIERSIAQINARWGTHYRPEPRVIDAASFGVPQRRRRAIIVALRDGGQLAWPTPTHDSAPMRAWDAIGRLRVADLPVAVGKWADLLPSIPEGENYLWHTSRGGGRPLFGYRTRYWSFLLKLARDMPAWTLSAQPGPSTGPFHWANRPLAVEELLRLQSLPADWVVEGGYRDQVRQVGNATPALLAEVLGRAVLATLKLSGPTGALQLTIPRLRSVPKASPPEKLSAGYRSLEGDHPDHPGAGLGPKARWKSGTNQDPSAGLVRRG